MMCNKKIELDKTIKYNNLNINDNIDAKGIQCRYSKNALFKKLSFRVMTKWNIEKEIKLGIEYLE